MAQRYKGDTWPTDTESQIEEAKQALRERGIEVFNLSTHDEVWYSLAPREAVIAAYAQEQGDWNTWDYEKRYGHLVRKCNDRTWSLGDWACVER